LDHKDRRVKTGSRVTKKLESRKAKPCKPKRTALKAGTTEGSIDQRDFVQCQALNCPLDNPVNVELIHVDKKGPLARPGSLHLPPQSSY
jgi:hypothetical protein